MTREMIEGQRIRHLRSRLSGALITLALALGAVLLETDDPRLLEAEIEALGARSVLSHDHTRREADRFIRARLPVLEPPESLAGWQAEADRLRAAISDQILGSDTAQRWQRGPLRIEFLGPAGGGPGYSVEALRFEVLAGLWVPAWLYRPQPARELMPVMVAFTGHEKEGFRTKQVQLRSINLAKRGIVVLSPEWFGQGLLSGPEYEHERAAYLELLGTSGLAVFYLAAARALDVALSLEGVDASRAGVSGLSGGGWQSLLLSALDPRVRLVNSVAGFSSFVTRLDHFGELGDFEQLPTDLATVADYTHLVALLAPRPTLLSYNSLDDCCFGAEHALPPLLAAATPVFRLYGPSARLELNIDEVTPTHNFDRPHREALYRFLDEHWFGGSAPWSTTESDLDAELRDERSMRIELPENNLEFRRLALSVLPSVAREAPSRANLEAARDWQRRRREALHALIRLSDPLPHRATSMGEAREGDVLVRYWKLELGPGDEPPVWTVPMTEFNAGRSHDTVVLIGDRGRKELAASIGFELSRGRRVLAVDPFLTGEAAVDRKPYRFALLVSSVGSRALGLRVEQLRAVARWVRETTKNGETELRAEGPRSSLTALVMAALSPDLVDRVRVVRPLSSLRRLIEDEVSLADMPEVFCFGLLAEVEVSDLLHLIAPRPLYVHAPASELPPALPRLLEEWYALFGRELRPLEARSWAPKMRGQ